jgi:hypothetical protein
LWSAAAGITSEDELCPCGAPTGQPPLPASDGWSASTPAGGGAVTCCMPALRRRAEKSSGVGVALCPADSTTVEDERPAFAIGTPSPTGASGGRSHAPGQTCRASLYAVTARGDRRVLARSVKREPQHARSPKAVAVGILAAAAGRMSISCLSSGPVSRTRPNPQAPGLVERRGPVAGHWSRRQGGYVAARRDTFG